ncbi:uncharacterized protein FSUBG_6085 [Fusarium subglutinans]|uniref:BTB domain-containing protein n=1 Tax=Gibberella subglutinans TaxID=42677 RepID=A0A8H5PZZ6_GIBSU|nr:uncharacterized protein FSUBG_6085 [Fusarium subglutinans]KAF5606476.1 hypothetical protein FSUBG_6085 [Fusarium subglutinans]
MKSSLLVFAPKGDTDIILRKPNFRSHQEPLPEAGDPEAAEEEHEENENGEDKERNDQRELERPASEDFKDVTSSIQSLDDLKTLKPCYEHGQNVEICYRVSSAHLMLASPVFKAMLDGPFKESCRNEDGLFEVKAFESSAEALLILLDIFHGHHRDVPKTMDLSLLTEMSILVDYYECHEIVEMFAENWVASVIQEDEIEGSDYQTNMSRLFISWVFAKSELFNSIVHTVLKLTPGPIYTDLPLPSTILDSLDQRRKSLTKQFLDNLYELLESFWSTDGGCRKECTAIMLGMLIKQMRSFGLEVPRAKGQPAEEKSFLELQEFSTNLETPQWSIPTIGGIHKCSFKGKTDPWLEKMSEVDICHGVRFGDFKLASSVQKIFASGVKKEKPNEQA